MKIIHGNALDYIDQIPKDAYIITDPPYNQKYHYNKYKDNLDYQEYRDLLYNILEGRKSIVIHYPEETISILGTLDIGELREVVSWVYPSNTAKQHRLITWWNCKPDLRRVGQDYKNPNDKRIKKRIAEGKRARLYDWWEINQVKNVSKGDNPHPCPIPYELAERIILTSTDEGDLIVDPFCGSGTIGLAAKNNNRQFIGIDLDKEYCDIADAKINN